MSYFNHSLYAIHSFYPQTNFPSQQSYNYQYDHRYGWTTYPSYLNYQYYPQAQQPQQIFKRNIEKIQKTKENRQRKSKPKSNPVNKSFKKHYSSEDEYRPIYSPESDKGIVMASNPGDEQKPDEAYHQSFISSATLPIAPNAPPFNSNNASISSISTSSNPTSPVSSSNRSIRELVSPSPTSPINSSVHPVNEVISAPSSQVDVERKNTQEYTADFPLGRQSSKEPIMTTERYKSEMEQAIRNSKTPIESNESEIIEIPELGIKGIWLNKAETENWKGGDEPISEYKFNLDPNPEKITLKYASCVERIESQTIKFLKPPEPPKPGNLTITQLPDYQPPEAPPVIIRQLAPENCDPKPVVIRERPPQPPKVIPAQEIIVPGKRLEPPPRRVILEKLAKQPDEIKAVTVERWLPYDQRSRRIIFNKAPEVLPLKIDKNVEYVWETPCVEKKTDFKNLGVEVTDPAAYIEKHNGSLINSSSQLPEFALRVQVPGDIDLNSSNALNTQEHTLTGETDALRLVDLNREELAIYRRYL